jgi:GT2 family glycosyltransferase
MTSWILCPLRNNLALTRKAFPTFLSQDIGNVQVMLLDNASTDGTTEWLRSADPDTVTAMYRRVPSSVAQSWNTGLDYIFNTRQADYALVVNNDVELPEHFFRLLLEDGGQFVTGVGVDDPECLKRSPHPESKSPHPHFSAFLIRRECWATVGPFDEAFKGAYAEDSDLHVRMHMAGITAYSIDVPFYHVGSSTLKHADPDEAQRIRLQADANREYFQKKWGFAVGSPEYYAFFEKPYKP